MIAACLACGPSLTAHDVQLVHDLDLVIAINNAVSLAPWADVLLGGDLKWWRWNHGAPGFSGRKLTCHSIVRDEFPDVEILFKTGIDGCEFVPGRVRTGGNSGYVAIQLAVQMGATNVILLGYDMQPSATGTHHWHSPHVNNTHPNYAACLRHFETLREPLASRGIEVINCSPRTALRTFPSGELSQILNLVSWTSTPPPKPRAERRPSISTR